MPLFRPSRARWGLYLSLVALCAGGADARAADAPAAAQVLDFDSAEQTLLNVSDSLAAADASRRASVHASQALKSLRLPTVTLDVQEIRYRKTLDLPLSLLNQGVESVTSQFIDNLPDTLSGIAGASQQLIEQIASRLEARYPAIADAVPDYARVQYEDSLLRPTVTAALPLFTGGAISSLQDAAAARVDLADAQYDSSRNLLGFRLAQVYFGQRLARQILTFSTQLRDDFEAHFDNAVKLEQQGMLSHARRLQVEVARNAALRQYQRADNDDRAATDALTRLLQSERPVEASEPLFVLYDPLPPLERFSTPALDQHPQVREVDAGRRIAQQGRRLARSRLWPQVYAFGEYNLDRSEELPIEPDWVVGIGLRYTLMSNVDRVQMDRAANAKADAAEKLLQSTRNELLRTISRSYDLVDTARRQFLLLQVNIDAARENQRVQTLAFREGQATATDLIDAQNALMLAQTQRATEAYEYDVALAALLTASGRGQDFGDYVRRRDRWTVP
ncbi:TolC family protein [Solimonas marina]|uniref:TolC family protein n=1 Tax=Solimonas marina TaxID=2714601 RepID=A0A969W7I0_9GAMM|nr:TolC family protein [Solimonas marina]NKF21837.1 TolC family protein [Solimonas marina]